MSFEIDIVPTEKLVRALQRHRPSKRNRTLVAAFIQWFVPFAIIGAIGLVIGFLVEHPWMYVGAAIIGCGLVFASSIPLLVWAGSLRSPKAVLESLRRKTHPGTRYQFTDAGVRFEAEFGFTFLKWRAFRKLFQSDDCLLLYWDEDRCLALPIDALNAELQRFIQGKCKESGVPLQV